MAKKKEEITIRSSAAEYLTYVATVGDQQDSIEMRYEDENIWLTQKMMAALYDVSVAAINQHIKKVYNDSELEPEESIKKYLIVQNEGSRQVSRETNHYNLQMIIAVGFKVNNDRAIQFRKWVNHIVKDYTIKGWVMISFAAKTAFRTLGNPVYGMHCRNTSMIFSEEIPTFRAPLICTSNCGSHPPAVRRLAKVIISRS